MFYMKRFLLVSAFLLPVFVAASYKAEKRIDKLARPYETAVESLAALQTISQLDDYTIYKYFTESGLSTKKDQRKFDRSLKMIKALARINTFSFSQKNKISFLIDNLDRVHNFIIEHASTHYAYYDIAGYYHYVDEQQSDLAEILMETSTQLMLPSMHGRGLYKFVKKIDLDLRRLNALFINNNLSDAEILKINQLKNKLLTLKNDLTDSFEYQRQLSKTRWLKAAGVLSIIIIIPVVSALVGLVIALNIYGVFAYAATDVLVNKFIIIALWSSILIPSVAITVKEMHESTKYQIAVHSTSLFSFFRPWFWPLTWIPRG